MNANHSAPDLQGLFAGAHDDGDLSSASYDVLSVPDIGTQIQNALSMGVPAEAVTASRVVLYTALIDDSSSIAFKRNESAVREGHNGVIEALRSAKAVDEILAQTRYINGYTLHPYRFLADIPRLDKHNYRANGMTPLYDQTIVTLGSVIAKAREFERSGVPVSTVTLIVTDGDDQGSMATAHQVRPIAEDMLARENHIIAGMGISDGKTDFRRVFVEMGIQPQWILTPMGDPKAIRNAFQLFSQSASAAVQGGQTLSFTSQTGFSMGGFGN
jgi:hypothetical protein